MDIVRTVIFHPFRHTYVSYTFSHSHHWSSRIPKNTTFLNWTLCGICPCLFLAPKPSNRDTSPPCRHPAFWVGTATWTRVFAGNSKWLDPAAVLKSWGWISVVAWFYFISFQVGFKVPGNLSFWNTMHALRCDSKGPLFRRKLSVSIWCPSKLVPFHDSGVQTVNVLSG